MRTTTVTCTCALCHQSVTLGPGEYLRAYEICEACHAAAQTAMQAVAPRLRAVLEERYGAALDAWLAAPYFKDVEWRCTIPDAFLGGGIGMVERTIELFQGQWDDQWRSTLRLAPTGDPDKHSDDQWFPTNDATWHAIETYLKTCGLAQAFRAAIEAAIRSLPIGVVAPDLLDVFWLSDDEARQQERWDDRYVARLMAEQAITDERYPSGYSPVFWLIEWRAAERHGESLDYEGAPFEDRPCRTWRLLGDELPEIVRRFLDVADAQDAETLAWHSALEDDDDDNDEAGPAIP